MRDFFTKNRFLIEELIKRDFKKKYKGTYLGALWSILSPLIVLSVMMLVFSRFFGGSIEHYVIYVFCGNVIYSYFADAANGGMVALLSNADIFTTVRTPKHLFVFSKNVTCLVNFGLTLILLICFCIIDGVTITPYFLLLLYPIACIFIFNVGIGLILSPALVFFRDTQYLFGIFTTLLTYVSAIFYSTETFTPAIKAIFYANPIYVYITYFREAILGASLPSAELHFLCIAYAAFFLLIGSLVYRRTEKKFIYYL